MGSAGNLHWENADTYIEYSDGRQYFLNVWYECPGGGRVSFSGLATTDALNDPTFVSRMTAELSAQCAAPAAPTPDPTCADCNAGVVDTHTTPAATQAPATSAPPPRPSAPPTPAVSAPSAPALGFLGNTTPVGGAPVWIVAVAALLLARKVKLL